MLRIRPADFWDMTYSEWLHATDGYVENLMARHNIVTPMTKDDLRRLEAEIYG